MHTYLLPWCFAEICSSFIDKSGSVWLAGLWWEESGLPTDWVKGRQAGDEDGGSRHITGPWDRWKPQSTHRWETRESLCALWINHCLSRKLCVLLSKTGTKQLKKSLYFNEVQWLLRCRFPCWWQVEQCLFTVGRMFHWGKALHYTQLPNLQSEKKCEGLNCEVLYSFSIRNRYCRANNVPSILITGKNNAFNPVSKLCLWSSMRLWLSAVRFDSSRWLESCNEKTSHQKEIG